MRMPPPSLCTIQNNKSRCHAHRSCCEVKTTRPHTPSPSPPANWYPTSHLRPPHEAHSGTQTKINSSRPCGRSTRAARCCYRRQYLFESPSHGQQAIPHHLRQNGLCGWRSPRGRYERAAAGRARVWKRLTQIEDGSRPVGLRGSGSGVALAVDEALAIEQDAARGLVVATVVALVADVGSVVVGSVVSACPLHLRGSLVAVPNRGSYIGCWERLRDIGTREEWKRGGGVIDG